MQAGEGQLEAERRKRHAELHQAHMILELRDALDRQRMESDTEIQAARGMLMETSEAFRELQCFTTTHVQQAREAKDELERLMGEKDSQLVEAKALIDQFKPQHEKLQADLSDALKQLKDSKVRLQCTHAANFAYLNAFRLHKVSLRTPCPPFAVTRRGSSSGAAEEPEDAGSTTYTARIAVTRRLADTAILRRNIHRHIDCADSCCTSYP